MSKIICDVCGTRYPDTAERCPICGSVRSESSQITADDMILDDTQYGSAGSKGKGGHFSKSNVRKRNRGVPQDVMDEKPKTKAKAREKREYDFPENNPKDKSNVVLNVLLVLAIIGLLSVTGYIFAEYFLPGMLKNQEPTEPSVTVVPTTEETTEVTTEIPTIPCTALTLPEGEMAVTLTEEGQPWLLNVSVDPDDTTDEVLFTSSDETIVAVNEEGRITAMGEGQATVSIICGGQTLNVAVTVDFTEPTEENQEPEENETVGATDETKATDATESTDATDATEGTTAPTGPLKDVTLKVNMTDITFNGRNQGCTFRVEGLKNSEVQWKSEDENIVTVKDGKAISVGPGTTKIIAQYGEQKVEIVVRCRF